jgi:hypothetical protein
VHLHPAPPFGDKVNNNHPTLLVVKSLSKVEEEEVDGREEEGGKGILFFM